MIIIKYKNFIIYDTEKLPFETNDDTYVFSAMQKYAVCKGCFDCWLKTPGRCSMKDSVCGLADYLAQSECLTIISRCVYGGYSKQTKGIIDRLIAYNLPFFKKINNELHHKPRYANKIDLNVIFYGENITDKEMQTAVDLVNANALNFNVKNVSVRFCKDKEVIL